MREKVSKQLQKYCMCYNDSLSLSFLLSLFVAVIASSKKIVIWKFGYPDDKKVHDVTLKHSVTGGKKVHHCNSFPQDVFDIE